MSLPNVSASEPAQPAHRCDGTGSASTEPLDHAAAVRYLYEELTPERPLGFHSFGTERARAAGRAAGPFQAARRRRAPGGPDGAHNAFKLAPVVATLEEIYPGRRFTWVLALKHDKDLGAVLRVLAPSAARIVATEFQTDGGEHPSSWSHRAEDIAPAAPQHRLASRERA